MCKRGMQLEKIDEIQRSNSFKLQQKKLSPEQFLEKNKKDMFQEEPLMEEDEKKQGKGSAQDRRSDPDHGGMREASVHARNQQPL